MFGSRLSNNKAFTAVTETNGILSSEDSFRFTLKKAVGDTGLLPAGVIPVFSHGII